jgi:hypothetical protein
MRRAVVLPLILLTGLQAFAAKAVKTAQLEQEVASAHSKHDADAAHRLSRLTLAEPLNHELFEKLKSELPGDQSRAALTAIADLAAFLPAGRDEILPDPAPAVEDQRRILKEGVAYLTGELPKLPNFLAEKRTMRFEEQPDGDAPPGPMLWAGRLDEQVSFEEGKEVLKPVDAADAGQKQDAALRAEAGLHTWGEFGGILTLVLNDALRNAIAWREWQKSPVGRVAVFAFAVPTRASHYTVDYCCVHDAAGQMRRFKTLAGYVGELSLDPESGSIMRLRIRAEFGSGDPVKSSELLVEYGLVDIGGKKFNCPLRSVALFRVRPEAARDLNMMPGVQKHLVIGGATDTFLVNDKTMINDAEFTGYHQFRGEMRIVTETPLGPDGKPAPAAARSEDLSRPAETSPEPRE